MVSSLKILLNSLHPILRPIYQWYSSKPRKYKYQDIQLAILPGVFHPGLFFSTKALLTVLQDYELQGKRVLELGAGSGLLSIYCSKRHAHVIASDISPVALNCLQENINNNKCPVKTIESDLFDNINLHEFDLILINPPYYPKRILSEQDIPWFCGENFEYFQKLFLQLKDLTANQEVLMVLSEDCDLKKITGLAAKNQLKIDLNREVSSTFERNFIFFITKEE